MNFFRENDLPGMLKDFGVQVQTTAGTITVLIDSADAILSANGSPSTMLGKSIVLTGRTSDVQGLALGSHVTFDSTNFAIREKQQLGDGALTQVMCSRV